MQGPNQAGLPLKLRSSRRAGIGADRRDVRCTDGARAHSPPLTVTPPAGIIAPSLFEVGVGRFLRREPVMTLVMLIVAADRKSTRLNSSHVRISYALFFLEKKKKNKT